ncbi:hypothetical protein ACQU0X_10975 [Pseudovibrio ascidiaceicola]|uniref:hypothetical protein n=1 Tax=Pseudovibrio ascidiaceicola TaxID=285279 RepID=UPI003D36D013
MDPENMQGFNAKQSQKALFKVMPIFTIRDKEINATPYSAAFDSEADIALIQMAETDSFECWNNISLGAWRVIQDRYQQTLVMLGANLKDKATIMDRFPSGLSGQQQGRALLLRYALGLSRTIDRQLLPLQAPELQQLLPAEYQLQKH